MKIGLFLSLSFVLNRTWEMEDCIGLLSPLLTFLLLEKSCVVVYCFELLEDTSVFSGNFIYFCYLHFNSLYREINFAEMNELLKPDKFGKTNDFDKDTKQSVKTILLILLLPGMYFILFCLPDLISFPFNVQKQPQPTLQFLRNKKPKILFSPWKPKVYQAYFIHWQVPL